MPTIKEVLGPGLIPQPADEKITLEPMIKGEFAPELVTHLSPNSLVVKVYGLLEDGRARNPLVPARAFRDIGTKLRAHFPPIVLPVLTTPEALHRLGIECYTYKIAEDGELLITLLSAHHESVNLTHGQNLAVLHFVNTLMVD